MATMYPSHLLIRSETVRSALDVISVCCVAPRVQLLLTEKIDMRDTEMTTGVNIVLDVLAGAADGEIVPEPDVQKAALNVLVNCVCAPVHRADDDDDDDDDDNADSFDPSQRLLGKPALSSFVLRPHKCPEPRRGGGLGGAGAEHSVLGRVARRELGLGGARRAHARLVHAHFAPVRTLRLQDDDAYFTHTLFH
ncbi:hypothetical protein HF086_013736, partial [Spodoptera exigua]